MHCKSSEHFFCFSKKQKQTLCNQPQRTQSFSQHPQNKHTEKCACTHANTVYTEAHKQILKVTVTNSLTSTTSLHARAELIVCRIDFLFNYQTSKLV